MELSKTNLSLTYKLTKKCKTPIFNQNCSLQPIICWDIFFLILVDVTNL